MEGKWKSNKMRQLKAIRGRRNSCGKNRNRPMLQRTTHADPLLRSLLCQLHSLTVCKTDRGDTLEGGQHVCLPVVQVTHLGGPVLAVLPPRLDHGLAREGVPADGEEALLRFD